MYLSKTTLFDGRNMYRIYYIENNYMFRHLKVAIFRLRNEKNIVGSYTRLMWDVYSGHDISHVLCRAGEISCAPHLLLTHCIHPT